MTEYQRALHEAGIPLEKSWGGAPEYNNLSLLVDACKAGDIEGIERFNKLDRKEFIKTFGFAIPTHEALKLVARYSPLIEVGAGVAYWAWELGKLGADVIATDIHPPDGKGPHKFGKQWVEVLPLSGQEAVDTYPERTLLMLWPSLGEDWAAEVLRKYRGAHFVYVGEYRDCCADDTFFDLLEAEWDKVVVVQLPVWYGIHDVLMFFKRKESK